VFVQGKVKKSTVQTKLLSVKKYWIAKAVVFIFEVAWYQPCCQM